MTHASTIDAQGESQKRDDEGGLGNPARFPGRGALTAAAWLWFVTGLAHGLGALQERLAGPPPETSAAVAAMKATVFSVGALSTDFYRVHLTFSWLFSVFLWVTAAGLWFDLRYVTSPAGRRALALRQVVYAAGMVFVSCAFLAPPPVPFGLAIMVLGVVSWRRQMRAAA
jgi:hypothetical protein